jgi:hypothetical protein
MKDENGLKKGFKSWKKDDEDVNKTISKIMNLGELTRQTHSHSKEPKGLL